MNKAHREGMLAPVPPFPKLKASKARSRWLTKEEEVRLFCHAAPHLRRLMMVAVDTGGHRGELLSLDWHSVDLSRNTITFLDTKNGEDRSTRLTDRAKRVLVEVGPKPTGSVFTFRGKPIRSIKSSFDKPCRKAGIENFRFHDLRHTFASRLVQKGIPLYEVMHLTGHKSFDMVQRYAHLGPDFQERAIMALNDDDQDVVENQWHDLGTVDSVPTVAKPSKSLKGNGAAWVT